MMKSLKIAIYSALLMLFWLSGMAQQKVDGTIAFQTDPAKKYSLYIPASYNESNPISAMLALHPLNTSRWDAQSWRDTLTTFAENNDLILICPDGGPDGRIDDPIDTAFTTFLLDSLERAYNIDVDNIYVMGFSWGGRTTYTYGLSHIDRFAGLMPIGAAINGLNEVGGLVEEGKDHNIFIIHGQNDSPNSRFFPVRDALEEEEACVWDTLMPNVGHTIDFPGRNDLLTMGYDYLVNHQCGISTNQTDQNSNLWSPQNPWGVGWSMEVPDHVKIQSVCDLNGIKYEADSPLIFETAGVYFIRYKTKWGRVGLAKLVVNTP